MGPTSTSTHPQTPLDRPYLQSSPSTVRFPSDLRTTFAFDPSGSATVTRPAYAFASPTGGGAFGSGGTSSSQWNATRRPSGDQHAWYTPAAAAGSSTARSDPSATATTASDSPGAAPSFGSTRIPRTDFPSGENRNPLNRFSVRGWGFRVATGTRYVRSGYTPFSVIVTVSRV